MTTLRTEGAIKRFGGLTAVDTVSLELRAGEIHGLIGPNGCGKTTLLNLISGFYPLSEGRILLDGLDLTHQPVQARADLGIARTFQKPRLLGTLRVLDNVMLGAFPRVKAGFAQTLLGLPLAERADRMAEKEALALLDGVGLGHLAEKRADLLDHAEQRFLEIARALAVRPRFILLDEPAGGLTEAEIEALAQVVTTVRDCGIGVLIVEHHTDFVFRICDQVTALNLGRTLRHGLPHEVRHDLEVIRVYLGA